MATTIEQIYSQIRETAPEQIDAEIRAHQKRIKILRNVLMMIRESQSLQEVEEVLGEGFDKEKYESRIGHERCKAVDE